MSPFLAQSRHPDRVDECPLSGVKRIWIDRYERGTWDLTRSDMAFNRIIVFSVDKVSD
jgi:hypothetical protein